jgi:hypothetical protein
MDNVIHRRGVPVGGKPDASADADEAVEFVNDRFDHLRNIGNAERQPSGALHGNEIRLRRIVARAVAAGVLIHDDGDARFS